MAFDTSLLDEIEKTRTIDIMDAIDLKKFNLITKAFARLSKQPKKSVKINICSGGGDAETALALVGLIRGAPFSVTTTGYGEVHSAAVVILDFSVTLS